MISAGPTGIENESNNQNAWVISNNQLMIQNTVGENQLVTMFDLEGRVLIRERITSVSKTIDLSHLAPGIFLIALQENNSILTRKIFLH
jgi:hypothetical protein